MNENVKILLETGVVIAGGVVLYTCIPLVAISTGSQMLYEATVLGIPIIGTCTAIGVTYVLSRHIVSKNNYCELSEIRKELREEDRELDKTCNYLRKLNLNYNPRKFR